MENKKENLAVSVLICLMFASIVALALWKEERLPASPDGKSHPAINDAGAKTLYLKLDDLGRKMVEAGVIDKEKFLEIYAVNPEMIESGKKLLEEKNVRVALGEDNSHLLLNYLWALGLGNKNEILEKGEMMDPRYGGASNFASTGGWTLGKGGAMDHYSMHKFITLSSREQALVDKVSRNIYRPCCRNSAHFPDCNHGMAMLGFLELAASQGASEREMYDGALALNSYWFPETREAGCGTS